MSKHITRIIRPEGKKVEFPFFKRFKIKLRCTVDSFHGSLVCSRVFEVPRPLVSMGTSLSARLYLCDFVRFLVAEKYYNEDSSCSDFCFSDARFTYPITNAKNILSGYLFRCSITFDFNYANVDRGCDCVSSGRCDFSVYEVR